MVSHFLSALNIFSLSPFHTFFVLFSLPPNVTYTSRCETYLLKAHGAFMQDPRPNVQDQSPPLHIRHPPKLSPSCLLPFSQQIPRSSPAPSSPFQLFVSRSFLTFLGLYFDLKIINFILFSVHFASHLWRCRFLKLIYILSIALSLSDVPVDINILVNQKILELSLLLFLKDFFVKAYLNLELDYLDIGYQTSIAKFSNQISSCNKYFEVFSSQALLQVFYFWGFGQKFVSEPCLVLSKSHFSFCNSYLIECVVISVEIYT